MYRISFRGAVLTKKTRSLKKAKKVRSELLKHFFEGYTEKDLPIIDDNGNVVVG